MTSEPDRDLRQTVVYAAGNVQQAFLLKNLLAAAGIAAEVTNTLLEGGSGVDIVGWPTLPRVVVAEPDAARAREIADAFDRETIAVAQSTAEDEPAAPADVRRSEPWPTCPSCGRRRMTRCPVCGTAGNEFPAADAVEPPEPGVDVLHPETAASGCGCGPGGCTSAGHETNDAADSSAAADAEPSQPLCLCPTCDEAFVPEYAGRCEWCGHEFADGYRSPSEQLPVEAFNTRMAAVVAAILLLGVAMLVYFVLLL